jgi:hypothetical protein
MKRQHRLNAQERRLLSELGAWTYELRLDWPRRLRNALIALANMDPGWMIWVEQNISSPCSIPEDVRVVEARARELLLRRGYSYLGESMIQTIIAQDRPFGDQGQLVPN